MINIFLIALILLPLITIAVIITYTGNNQREDDRLKVKLAKLIAKYIDIDFKVIKQYMLMSNWYLVEKINDVYDIYFTILDKFYEHSYSDFYHKINNKNEKLFIKFNQALQSCILNDIDENKLDHIVSTFKTEFDNLNEEVNKEVDLKQDKIVNEIIESINNIKE